MSESPAEKLARIRAAKATLQAARLAPPSDDDQIAQADQELQDEEAFAKILETHGKKAVGSHSTPMGLFILKKPDQATFRRYQDQASERGAPLAAQHETFVRNCLLYPSAAKLDALLNEYPGQLVQLADLGVALARGDHKEAAGK